MRSTELRARRVAREKDRALREHQRASGEARGCLFCRRNDGGFSSQEHIFPEGLGNTEHILEPGVVCDRCNNTTLSQLDHALLRFGPLDMRRTMLGVPSKTGKVPTFRFSEGTLEHQPGSGGAEPVLAFSSRRPGGIIREETCPDGRIRWEWNFRGGRRMTPRYCSQLARALLKAGLECAWLDHGEMMLEERFDHVRQAVLGEPWEGHFAFAHRGDPNGAGGQLVYRPVPGENGLWRMMVAVSYLGIFMATDSRLAEPPGELPEDTFTILKFGGPTSPTV